MELLKQDSLACQTPHLMRILIDGGYAVAGQKRNRVEVETDEADMVAASRREVVERLYRADRHQVVGDEHGIEVDLALQHLPHRIIAAIDAVVTILDL